MREFSLTSIDNQIIKLSNGGDTFTLSLGDKKIAELSWSNLESMRHGVDDLSENALKKLTKDA